MSVSMITLDHESVGQPRVTRRSAAWHGWAFKFCWCEDCTRPRRCSLTPLEFKSPARENCVSFPPPGPHGGWVWADIKLFKIFQHVTKFPLHTQVTITQLSHQHCVNHYHPGFIIFKYFYTNLLLLWWHYVQVASWTTVILLVPSKVFYVL